MKYATACKHTDRELHALGLCVSCYQGTRLKNSAAAEAIRQKNYRRRLKSGQCATANWRYRLKKRFGINEELYNQMLIDHEHVCAICKRPSERPGHRKKRLAVDHNHATNTVRGLLCDGCNRALGLFQDSEEVLLAAIEYLRKHSLKLERK